LSEFTVVETTIQEENPTLIYPDVLATAYGFLATEFSVDRDLAANEAKIFGGSVGKWQPFPDTVSALAVLSKHFKLVVLSNVDQGSFSHTRKLLEKGFTFDMVCTAQDIGSYKPDIRNFEYVLKSVKEKFGIEREEVLVTAQSLSHDHVPANKLGLGSAWIDREGAHVGVDETLATFTFRYRTLGELAAAVEKE